MTVGGIGGAETTCWSCMQPCSCCHRRDWSGRWTKRFSSGELIAFLRLFKVVRERGYYTAALEEGVALSSFISAHGREREHFGHMHMRWRARTHTHREPKHTDTLSGTHMEISVQDSVENALPAHILRTQKCALHTHTRAHARKHAPLALHATPAVLPPHLPQVQDVKHGLKDPHTDGAAPPGGPDSPRRRWRGRGCVHRCNIRGVHRHRAPAALVAVLGA